MPRLLRAALLGALALLASRPAAAQHADPWSACARAIAALEGIPGFGLPPGLLGAIALVESGRRDPATGRIAPWPFAWNAEGRSGYPPSRAAAVAEVAALQAGGVRSIDVGCMQVNLMHHPRAFASLDQAFDPEANVRYARRFLLDLHARTGDWAQAVASYHSGDAGRGLAYHRRVALARLGATGQSAVPLPAAAAAGLCARNLAPVLLLRWSPSARRAGVPARAVPRPRVVCRPPGRLTFE